MRTCQTHLVLKDKSRRKYGLKKILIIPLARMKFEVIARDEVEEMCRAQSCD